MMYVEFHGSCMRSYLGLLLLVDIQLFFDLQELDLDIAMPSDTDRKNMELRLEYEEKQIRMNLEALKVRPLGKALIAKGACSGLIGRTHGAWKILSPAKQMLSCYEYVE
jgi:hypothetical protein